MQNRDGDGVETKSKGGKISTYKQAVENYATVNLAI